MSGGKRSSIRGLTHRSMILATSSMPNCGRPSANNKLQPKYYLWQAAFALDSAYTHSYSNRVLQKSSLSSGLWRRPPLKKGDIALRWPSQSYLSDIINQSAYLLYFVTTSHVPNAILR
jgi:hypothetical protein